MSITPPSTGVTVARLTTSARSSAVRFAAALFATAGVLFIVYPASRPYSSEVGLAGAAAFGSGRWVLAHVAGMVAFGCLAAGCCLLAGSRMAKVGTALSVGLILPYYGTEAFGLHAIGGIAMRYGASNLAETSDAMRYDPVALSMFGAGWVVLAVAGAALARLLWTRGIQAGALLVGAGLALYLPQFFGPPWIRILHGVALAVGLTIVAIRLVTISTDE